MTLALIIALPFLGMFLPLFAERLGRSACATAAAIAPLVGLVLLLSQQSAVFAGELLKVKLEWLPAIGLNFSLRLDGLGFLFALLILGIGLLVILYARYYLSKSEPMGRFYAFLLLFMGAMLGVVLSDNLIVLYVFWEVTSMASALLISYWFHKDKSTKGAQKSMLITVAGGLAMLGGFILLYQMTGTFSIRTIIAVSYTHLTLPTNREV